MKPTLRLLIAAALSASFLLCAPRPGGAATVYVPPVTITQLTHIVDNFSNPPVVHDAVIFGDSPETGYTSDGFTAAISTGDTVVVRFQAAPGKKFVVHNRLTSQYFYSYAVWSAGGSICGLTTTSVESFEGFKGALPTETEAFNLITCEANVVEVDRSYVVTGDFEFTALQFKLVGAGPSTPGVPLSFPSIGNDGWPSWGASGRGDPSVTLMEIVDTAVPTTTTTWGRLKTLYR